MKFALALSMLVLTQITFAAQPTMYRCLQPGGSVVIQDRRCAVTELQKPKTVRPTATNRQNRRSTTSINRDLLNKSKNTNRKVTRNSHSVRSPYFNYGWDKFIPANWQLHKTNTDQYDQLLISRSRFNGYQNFKEGIKLSVYPDTMRLFRQGAFAEALKHYHEIRDNSKYRLLDSQFKTHTHFKVFNIKYMLNNNILALTEFYIDEKHNDLFVLTVQSQEATWLSNWKFAEQIINKL